METQKKKKLLAYEENTTLMSHTTDLHVPMKLAVSFQLE